MKYKERCSPLPVTEKKQAALQFEKEETIEQSHF